MATKKAAKKSSKRLHRGKKLEEQKPLKVSMQDFSITRKVDKASPVF